MSVLCRVQRAGSVGLTFLLLAVLTGCGVSSPRTRNVNPTLDSDTVVMLDKRITTQLARQSEWTEFKNGFLEANVVLRNLGGRILRVEIMAYFSDSRGGRVESSLDVWDVVTINPHEDFHYQRLSPSNSAESYQFHIRLAKESR